MDDTDFGTTPSLFWLTSQRDDATMEPWNTTFWPNETMDIDDRSENTTASIHDDLLNLYHVHTGVIVLLAALYGSISLLAIIGNGAVIYVVGKNRKMQTVTNIFIVNMAFADVLIGLFSIPFQFHAAILQRWVLAAFMCPLAPFVQVMTVNVSIFTLMILAIDRYFAVIHPLKPRVSKQIAKIAIAITWTFAILSGLPTLFFNKVILIQDEMHPGRMKDFCDNIWPEVFRKMYTIYLVVLQYILPLSVILCAYIRVGCRVWGSKSPGFAVDSRDRIINRNKRKVIKMLIVVVALFALCWLPLQAYHLLAEIDERVNQYKYINIIWFCSNWLAMSNSCYNPFIYGLLSEKYKRAFRQLFAQCFCHPCFGDKHCDSDENNRKSTSSHTTSESTIRIGVNNSRYRRYMKVTIQDEESSYV
ncbi:neuropeptide Y receptor type 2-like isoform X1 [Lineus longissimus]|uniref:neuropeptide Y receptor type 2-like isoform X1 n=1 Tax=Lineus longissimus TaxID=88925 RepID=UPI00315C759A